MNEVKNNIKRPRKDEREEECEPSKIYVSLCIEFASGNAGFGAYVLQACSTLFVQVDFGGDAEHALESVYKEDSYESADAINHKLGWMLEEMGDVHEGYFEGISYLCHDRAFG